LRSVDLTDPSKKLLAGTFRAQLQLTDALRSAA